MIKRCFQINQLVKDGISFFIFGPRGVGKSFAIREFLKTTKISYLYYDLLSAKTFYQLSNDHEIFSAQITNELAQTKNLIVIIDEIQLIPNLLNEVHRLIELDNSKGKLQFILTGSSARKLKRAEANLLAGRARIRYLHPITIAEYDLNLYQVLKFGTLPYVIENPKIAEDFLFSYTNTYLQEEIKQEAAVKNLPAFIKFLDLAAQYNGKIINFSKLSRNIKVTSETIQNYYSILLDTLLAFRLDGWSESIKKQLSQAPKFYLFDCGIINALSNSFDLDLRSGTFHFGNLFESFIVNEIIKINEYAQKRIKLNYWRTSSGLEIDLVLSKRISEPFAAIEIKSSSTPDITDLKALYEFKKEYPETKLYCVCLTEKEFEKNGIIFLPWQKIASIF